MKNVSWLIEDERKNEITSLLLLKSYYRKKFLPTPSGLTQMAFFLSLFRSSKFVIKYSQQWNDDAMVMVISIHYHSESDSAIRSCQMTFPLLSFHLFDFSWNIKLFSYFARWASLNSNWSAARSVSSEMSRVWFSTCPMKKICSFIHGLMDAPERRMRKKYEKLWR